jgi:hypothetical protein
MNKSIHIKPQSQLFKSMKRIKRYTQWEKPDVDKKQKKKNACSSPSIFSIVWYKTLAFYCVSSPLSDYIIDCRTIPILLQLQPWLMQYSIKPILIETTDWMRTNLAISLAKTVSVDLVATSKAVKVVSAVPVNTAHHRTNPAAILVWLVMVLLVDSTAHRHIRPVLQAMELQVWMVRLAMKRPLRMVLLATVRRHLLFRHMPQTHRDCSKTVTHR